MFSFLKLSLFPSFDCCGDLKCGTAFSGVQQMSALSERRYEEADRIVLLWYAYKLRRASSFPFTAPGREWYSNAIDCRRKASLSPLSCLYPLSHQDNPSIITRKLPPALKSFLVSPCSLTFLLSFDFLSSACQHSQVPWHRRSYPLSHPPSLCPVPLQWQ